MRETFSVQDLCAFAGVSKTLVYEEIKRGRLIGRKLGRKTMFLRADVTAWLSNAPTLRAAA